MNSTGTSPPADTLQAVLQDWANARSRPVICITNSGSQLGAEHVVRLWRDLRGTFAELDLVVHSPGGDPNSAYQLAELIRSHTADAKKGLTAIVPFLAASAATLMCLACDQIILDDLGRLGPLDMQVYEDLKGGMFRYSSALHPQYALKQLNELSLASLLATKIALVKEGVLGDEAYSIAKDLVVGLYKDMYAQVSPERLAEYSRALDVNLKYAQCLLRRHSSLPEVDQDRLAGRLVKDYPSHAYYIDFEEAKALRLPVTRVPAPLRSLADRLIIQLSTSQPALQVVYPTPTDVAVAAAPAGATTAARSKAPKPSKSVRSTTRKDGARHLAISGSTNGKRG